MVWTLNTKLKSLANLHSNNNPNFSQILAEHRRKLLAPNKQLLARKTEFSSLDNIAHSLKEGRFCVDVNGAHFECLFAAGTGKHLYVAYNGLREKLSGYSPAFPRWSYYTFLDGSYLGIDDPTYFSGQDVYLSWFYGTKEQCYIIDSLAIIRAVCAAKNISAEDVIFFSSSGGGYCGLYASTLWEKSLSISLNPQLYLQNWPYAVEFQKKSGINLAENDSLNRNNLVAQIKAHSSSHHVIVSNVQSSRDFPRQIIPFVKELGINLRYGLNRYKNILIWIYDATYTPNPHIAYETRAIFLGIDFIAREFKKGWGEDIPDSMQSLAILINESWYDYYQQKEEKYNLEKNREIDVVLIDDNKNTKVLIETDKVESLGKVILPPRESKWNYFKYDKFSPLARYTIILEKPKPLTDIQQFTIGLFDFKKEKIVKYINYNFADRVCLSFVLGNHIDGIGLCIYAGISGETWNQSLSIDDIHIYKESI